MKALVLALLFALAPSTTRAQTTPADSQIFRDVYGNYDEAMNAVVWDGRGQKIPAPTQEDAMTPDIEHLHVQVLQRVLAQGKFYAIVIGSDVGYDDEMNRCHHCRVFLGAAVYQKAEQNWRLESSSPALIYGGMSTKPPDDIYIRPCSRENQCIVIGDLDCGPTETGTSCETETSVFAAIGSQICLVWQASGGSSFELSNHIPKWDRSTVSLHFSPDYVISDTAALKLFDLEVIRMTTGASHKVCKPMVIHIQRFRFNGEKYILKSSRTVSRIEPKDSCFDLLE